MPEYLAPGVYVEETSFRAKSIEGVSTSTAGFAGPTRRGPTSGSPELLTSFTDFERIYGGTASLDFGAGPVPNYTALAVKAFFDNGGRRLYVTRAVDGGAKASYTTDLTAFALRARSVGAVGNGVVTLKVVETPVSGAAVGRLPVGSVIRHDSSTSYMGRTGFLAAADDAVVTAPTAATVVTVDFVGTDADGQVQIEEGLGLHPTHARYLGAVLGATQTDRSRDLANVFALEIQGAPTIATLRADVDRVAALAGGATLTGGTDGTAPASASYETALADLEPLDDISTVAAPGHTAFDANVRGLLITHVETKTNYRVALLESAVGETPTQAKASRAAFDSKYAAWYYPWVQVANPNATSSRPLEPKELTVPPSGFVAGIFARSDNDQGVWKSPANEVVLGALRFERALSTGENELLNPSGVNCLRYFPGRGYRVWGARTITSDPEWKYLSVRRYFNYLEASIERGTQWAVFESNGERLWANITQTIDSFLYSEWRNGALLGATAKEAYFVRCDRTTMTQNDLDNGRLVCLIGVAVIKPAEFVIFRIGQKTASARD